ncbi:MAG: iron chelate uptake ABC transporter family permease subunit [Bacillota bacterium]|nr:iron chelate uptake ABC transporter family permease subunit [Bacillota bacterium]
MTGLSLLLLPFMLRAATGLIVASLALSPVGVAALALNLAGLRFTLMHLGLLGAAAGLAGGVDPFLAGMTFIAGGSLLFGPVADWVKLDVGQTSSLFMTGSLAAAFLLLYKADVPAMEAFSIFTGSILTLTPRDLAVLSLFGAGVLAVLGLWYWELNLMLFDQELAAALGVRASAFRYAVLALLGLAIGACLKLVGALMVDALLMLPAMAALPLARNLKHALVLSSFFGLISSTLGIVASLQWDLPISASVAMAGVLVLAASQGVRSIWRLRSSSAARTSA